MLTVVIGGAGVAVGSGWQGTVAYVNLGCYYIIGLPLGIVLGWVFHWGVSVIFSFLTQPTYSCGYRVWAHYLAFCHSSLLLMGPNMIFLKKIKLYMISHSLCHLLFYLFCFGIIHLRKEMISTKVCTTVYYFLVSLIFNHIFLLQIYIYIYYFLFYFCLRFFLVNFIC